VKPASLVRRLAAIAYDLVLLLALFFCITLVVLLARGGRAVEAGATWFGVLLYFLTPLGFFSWFWTHGGQTLGMRAWRLELVSTDSGGPVSWRKALIRYVAGWISTLPAGLGFWWSLVDTEHRCWHDRLSGTTLLYRPKK